MTASSPTLNNTVRHAFIAVVALLGTGIGFGATTAPARAAAPSYTAELAVPVSAPKQIVLGDAFWSCAGTTCHAASDTSRAEVSCARLAGKFGGVARFTSPKGELEGEGLAKCNVKTGGADRLALGQAKH